MPWKIAVRALLLTGSATIANSGLNSPLSAQARVAVDYDLPAQPLGDALRAIAQIAGREILFPPEAVHGRQAPQIKGRMSLMEAVNAAVAGSGLVAEQRSGAVIVKARSTSRVEPADRLAKGEAITVTGTRIRGAGSVSPVTVATRRALEEAGVANLADFTRILPQNYAGGQNCGIPGSGEQGGQQNLNNSATLNLRGLGPDATLTLLDGHRMSYDSINQGVDISAIPLEAIERIEVVTDGASALYGSDAVGGVANIILRRDYDGLETTARIEAATDGGDFQKQLSGVAGRKWASGGFMVALDASRETPIYADQRSFTHTVDRSLTLTDGNRQASAVVNAHQQVARGLTLEADGYYMDRKSLLQDPFLPNADVHVSGLVAGPHVRSYALTPALRADLGSWQATASATESESRTLLDTNNYYNSSPRHAQLHYDDTLKGVEATAEGPLVALPGGTARLAIGGGARGISLHERYVLFSNGQRATTKNFTERRSTHFAYGELSLPLVGPELELPFVRQLTLSGALRYEHWNGIASVTTPKLGLIYQPSGPVTFRATWGKSFKIPTLQQVNEIEEGDLVPGFYFVPPPQRAGAPVLLLTGSAPNLKPERATTWSGTLELRPFSGLQLRATYFDVDYRGRIASPLTSVLTALGNPLYDDFIIYNPSATQVNALIASLPGGLVNQTGQAFDPSAVGAIVDVADQNTERQRISGVDLDADYRLDFGQSGKLQLTGTASYLKSDQQLAPGQPVLPLAGTVFHPPHWRGRAGAVWDSKQAGASLFVNYVGRRIDARFPVQVPVSPFVTVDLGATFRTQATSGPMRGLEARISMINALNAKPHFVRSLYAAGAPFDSTNESPVGRFVGASLRKVW